MSGELFQFQVSMNRMEHEHGLVMHLIKAIAEELNVRLAQIRLVFAGQVLRMEDSLRGKGIKHESIVDVHLAPGLLQCPPPVQ